MWKNGGLFLVAVQFNGCCIATCILRMTLVIQVHLLIRPIENLAHIVQSVECQIGLVIQLYVSRTIRQRFILINKRGLIILDGRHRFANRILGIRQVQRLV